MAGLAALEDEFGEFTWSPRLFLGLSMVSPSKMLAVLSVGLRNDKGTLFSAGGALPAWPLDLPFVVLATRCQDAIALSIYGKSFAVWAADANAPPEEDDDPPPNGAEVL
jgi:hypothetical protein